MAQNTLQVRTKLRYHSYDQWVSNNPVLFAGEVGLATKDGKVLLKVGNGNSNYNDLPFLSALADDVPDWAKAPNKPSYSASEIKGLSDLIKEDTNTTYRIISGAHEGQFILQSKEKDSDNWADVYTLTIPDSITYTFGSDKSGQLTVTPSKGDIQKIKLFELATSKEDIATGSAKIPTAGAIADYTASYATRKDLEGKQDKLSETNKLPSSFVSGTATSEQSGLMSKEDKAKLDGIDLTALGGGAIEKIQAGETELPIVDKTVTLAKVAQTGNVNDLVQDEGDVLVLEGGGSLGMPRASGILILNGTIE